MSILDILQQDYQHFPKDQSYHIYANNVLFKDPLNQFRGVNRYQKMIQFLDRWFQEIQLELHHIERTDQQVRTDWTLQMTCPVPWRSRLSITGYSLLDLDENEQIIAHIDYWQDPPIKVLMQLFRQS